MLRVSGKTLKAVSLCAATEKMRYALNYIHVRPGEKPNTVVYEATDGRVALILTTVADPEFTPGDTPDKKTNPITEGFIAIDNLDRVRAKDVVIIDDVHVARVHPMQDRWGHKVKPAVATLHGFFTPKTAFDGGSFPNVQEVVPPEDRPSTTTEIGLNTRLLAKVLAAAEGLGFTNIRHRVGDRHGCVRYDANHEEGTLILLQMPVTID